MTEYTITGIRFQMAGESLEERTETAESFVAKLKKGQLVMLMAEPEYTPEPSLLMCTRPLELARFACKDPSLYKKLKSDNNSTKYSHIWEFCLIFASKSTTLR